MTINGTTTGMARPDNVFALQRDAWLQGALADSRGTLDDQLASTPDLRQRVWARIVTEIEADEAARFAPLAPIVA